MFAAINKEIGIVLSPELQMFSAPNGEVNSSQTFLLFKTKKEARFAASKIISPKFKVIEIK